MRPYPAIVTHSEPYGLGFHMEVGPVGQPLKGRHGFGELLGFRDDPSSCCNHRSNHLHRHHRLTMKLGDSQEQELIHCHCWFA